MEKQIQQVEHFHRTFGANIETTPLIPDDIRIKLRCTLVKEETGELVKAMEEGNLIEVADGIIDSMVVIIGTAIEYGLASILVEMFDEVQRSNMSKTDEQGKAIIREDGKILKSNLFTKPDLRSIIERSRISNKES